jgi:hypothetical protein
MNAYMVRLPGATGYALMAPLAVRAVETALAAK